MNWRCSKRIKGIATGFIVLVLYSIVLFWGRFFCRMQIIANIAQSSGRIIISPSGLIPGEPAPTKVGQRRSFLINEPVPNEPNIRFSEVYSNLDSPVVFMQSFGAFWDMLEMTVLPYDVNEKVYYRCDSNNNNYFYFDKRSGLLVNLDKYKKQGPNGKIISETREFFAGPNGVSLTTESSLGRFYDPLMGDKWPDRFWLYDRKLRQFYFVNFIDGVVKKGLQLEKDDSREPVAIGTIMTWPYYDMLDWNPPEVWDADNNIWVDQKVFLVGGEVRYCWSNDASDTFLHVLDKTGQIYIYNSKEQSLASVGYLPLPDSLFAFRTHGSVARPKDVLAYNVEPVYSNLLSSAEPNKPSRLIEAQYMGMAVSCISREGMSMTAAIFDPNGKLVIQEDTKIDGISTSRVVYKTAELHSTILFLLDNLQPPAFEAISFFSGNIIEAGAGHRALFILPNSFLGMLGRYTGPQFDQEVFGPLLIAPSLILSVWLAVRVRKDATLTGLNRTEKKWWMIGVIAFGLPAYITYRLTRPKETLVTCQNCGKMRRPDMETCHRCGSKWEIPELTPPDWHIGD